MILCGVIARGTTILAKYIRAGSNMKTHIDKALVKIAATSDTSNNSYTYGEFMIYYIRQRSFIFLAIAQKDISQEKAFEFLEDVKQKFETHAGERARNALENELDGQFEETLKNGMHRHSPSQLDNLNKDMDAVKEELIKAIEAALQRAEQMEILLAKTDDLQINTGLFRRNAEQINRHMWYVFEVGFWSLKMI